MSEYNKMRDILNETGLYNIEEGSLIYAELQAYSAGLELIFSQLRFIEQEAFVSTAKTTGLLIYEKTLLGHSTDHSYEGRRSSILSALSLTNYDFTIEGINKLLGIYNINGTIIQSGNDLHIRCENDFDISTKSAIEENIAKYAPMFTSITFE